MRRKTRTLTGRGSDNKTPKASRSLLGGMFGGIFRYFTHRLWQIIYPLLASFVLSILAIVASVVFDRIKKALSQRSS